MSQRYTIVSSFPVNLYCRNSPILVSAGALVKDNKNGKILVQLKFKNLSEHIIRAVKVSIMAFDVSGSQLVGIDEFQYLDLSVMPKESFGDDKAMTLPDTNTRTCTVIINEVLFTNEVPWKNADCAECAPIPVQIELQELLSDYTLLEQYKRDTTKHAKFKPAQYMDLWLCSCGTVNKRQDNKCSNCGIALQQLLEATNMERLYKNLKAYQDEKEWEANKRRQAEKKQRRIGIITVSCVLLLVALFFFVTNVIIPGIEYRAAERLLEKGEYEKAIIAFEELVGYSDSEERIEEAKFKIAEVERMAEEAEKASMYASAETLLNDGQTGLAAMAFYLAGDYKDAWERSMTCWNEVVNRKNISAAVEHTVALKTDGTIYSGGKVLHRGETIYTDRTNGDWKTNDWTDVISVCASEYNTIGLKKDGTIFVAGEPRHGIASTKDVVEVSAGMDHAVVLWANGCVGASGSNVQGQCNVSDWQGIISVSAGDGFTIGLQHDGTVVATGRNSYGQCNVSEWSDIVAISAGANHTVGLKSDGTVVATGDNTYGQCNVSSWKDIVEISASDSRGLSNVIGSAESHTIGLKSDGSVLAVGDNSEGQCNVQGWDEIVEIDAGYLYTVGLKLDGTIVAIGQNKAKQCDVSEWRGINIPLLTQEEQTYITTAAANKQIDYYATAETLLSEDKIIDAAMAFGAASGYSDAAERSLALWESVLNRDTICVSAYEFLVILDDGTVHFNGENNWGADDVSNWTDIVHLTSESRYTIGVQSDGHVLQTKDRYAGDASAWTDIVLTSGEYRHIVGLKSDGTVVAVGDNYEGQCDVSHWNNIVNVIAEDHYTIGITKDGGIKLAGSTSRNDADQIGDWSDIVDVCSFEGGSIGLKSDGTIITTSSIGSNIRNTLAGWTDIVDIATGYNHIVGLKSDGTVLAAGKNRDGQCEVDHWRDVVAVYAGGNRTAAVCSDGERLLVGSPG